MAALFSAARDARDMPKATSPLRLKGVSCSAVDSFDMCATKALTSVDVTGLTYE